MTLAAWVPGWYELDPQLEVGLNGEFAFWRVVPEYLSGPESLVLYNTLWHPEDAVIARGTTTAIRHPELGAIQKVDTRGLDYTITLSDGNQLLVNAEEKPGRAYERAGGEWVRSSRAITAWRFIVEFAALSDLQPA